MGLGGGGGSIASGSGADANVAMVMDIDGGGACEHVRGVCDSLMRNTTLVALNLSDNGLGNYRVVGVVEQPLVSI